MSRVLLLLLTAFALTACVEEGKYPVSGDECAEGDPVHEVTPPECAILPSGAGTF